MHLSLGLTGMKCAAAAAVECIMCINYLFSCFVTTKCLKYGICH